MRDQTKHNMKIMQYKFLPIESPGIVCVKLWVNGGSSRDKSNKKGENNLLASLLTRGCGKFNTIEKEGIRSRPRRVWRR